MWYRVFSRSADAPAPDELVTRLRAERPAVEGVFTRDGGAWTTIELRVGTGMPVRVERFRTVEDDLRGDLNSWAAYLETLDYSANRVPLMEHVIQARQLFTVRRPLDNANEAAVEEVCRAVCVQLATAADGIIQVEGDGWFAADGRLVLKEY